MGYGRRKGGLTSAQNDGSQDAIHGMCAAASAPLQQQLQQLQQAMGSVGARMGEMEQTQGKLCSAEELQASDLPCNVRREGGQSLVIGGPSLVILEGREGQSLVIGGPSLVVLEGKTCNPL